MKLGHRGLGTIGISAKQFHITFNKKGRLILTDFNSRYRTTVSYNSQVELKVQNNFTWILDLRKGKDKKEKKDSLLWDVKVHL
jgi:hypothetical protein